MRVIVCQCYSFFQCFHIKVFSFVVYLGILLFFFFEREGILLMLSSDTNAWPLKALDFSKIFGLKTLSFCWLQLLSFCSAQEVKEHPFFKGIDWQQVYLQKVKDWESNHNLLGKAVKIKYAWTGDEWKSCVFLSAEQILTCTKARWMVDENCWAFIARSLPDQ